jgi:hypothetical protein
LGASFAAIEFNDIDVDAVALYFQAEDRPRNDFLYRQE